jgi:oligopeptidase B
VPEILPPLADKIPQTLVHHGHERHDPWFWLRAENWQEALIDPSVLPRPIREHLERENAYAEAILAPSRDLQKTLFDEMRARIKEDDESLPVRDGPYVYYTRHRDGGEYPLFCRRLVNEAGEPEGEEDIYFDGDGEAAGTSYFSIGAAEISPDHRWMVYATDTQGSERYVARFRDLHTGDELDTVIADTSGSIVWANDNETIFYVVKDANARPYEVRRLVKGAPVESAVVVHTETEPGYYVSIGGTEDDRLILIEIHDHTTSEVWLIDADQPLAEKRLVAERQQGVQYSVSHRHGELFIQTNADGATDFKICRAPLDTPGRAHWVDWIAHNPGVLVVGDMIREAFYIRLERENALPRIVIHAFETGVEHVIDFAEEAYSLGLGVGDVAFDSREMRFSYASPTTPDEVYDYNLDTHERTFLKRRPIPSGHDPQDYVVHRLEAVSADGTRVPMTILHHRNTPIDGTAPALLYGYGSYGVSLPADFKTSRLSLVDRGVVFAIAHLRGGKERGYQWYLDGKLDKKENTFHDFIACADALVEHRFAEAGRICIMGGSAGGLLVGAVVNMAPEKFAGVVAQVPFVDVLSTMLDGDLPMTPPEWGEWGNPIESKTEYEWIRAYSPYDNVRTQAYPPFLVTAGVADSRVTYWEPAKWVQKLREHSTSSAPIVLKTNLDAGHGGASARWDSLKEVAEEYAFALAVLGDAEASLGRGNTVRSG